VFERHPNLLFVTTEIASAAEIARDLTRMDMMYKLRDMGTGTPFYPHVKDALAKLGRTPSEYFATNCYVGGPHDLRAARDAGIPNLMWGADIPHAEGTGPFTIEAIRAILCDLPQPERAELLADRAARVYQFDLDRLRPVAERIGPTVDQLETPLPLEARPKYPEETCCSVFRAAPIGS
jgi:hypothetical protein